MKKFLSFILCALFATVGLQAQSLDELKAKKADLEAQQKAKQGEADAFNGELGDLAKQIEVLSGWQTGLDGLVGFNLGSSNNWAANANRNSSSTVLNLGINAYANNIKEKSFWRNTLTSNLSWQGLDNNTNDQELTLTQDIIDQLSLTGVRVGDKYDPTGTSFDRNADVLIGSSLYGYRLNPDIAISALGDLNTSVFGFLAPGSFDIGAGITWTPQKISDLVVVIHPLTYHFAFSAFDNIESQSALGAKVKATYSHKFPGGIVWSSNLGAFLPYGDEKYPIMYTDDAGAVVSGEEGLFEYTWINSINIADVWKGVGVGITFGLRGAKFEFPPSTQTYSAVGLTYGF